MDEDGEPAPEGVVARDYVVQGVGPDTLVTEVSDISVGEHGELILFGADGGCAALFAPGHWRQARVADEPDA